MLEIINNNKKIIIKNSSKEDITIEYLTKEIFIWNLKIDLPWEYEKSWILLEAKEYNNEIFYNIVVEKKHIVVFFTDNFEIKEEIVDFFGDIDILFIPWTKESAKLFENIEAKVVIPFGEAKDIFLQTLGQNIEEVENYKIKSELEWLETIFINLKENSFC